MEQLVLFLLRKRAVPENVRTVRRKKRAFQKTLELVFKTNLLIGNR